MCNGCKTAQVLKATELDTSSQGIFLISSLISLVIHWFFSSMLLSLHIIIFFLISLSVVDFRMVYIK